MSSLEAFFAAVVDTSWRAGCAIVLLAVARRFLQGRIPSRLLFWIWLAIALRLLLPLSLPAAWSPFNLVPRDRSSTTEPVSPVASDANAPSAASSGPASVTTAASIPASDAFSLSLNTLAASVWIIGVVVLLALRALGAARLARSLRRTSIPLSPSMLPAAAAKRLHARNLSVFTTTAVATPALYGLFRPRILLPPGFVERLSPAELEHVFAHELAHARHRDLLADAVLHAAAVIHWFNPLVWLAVRLGRRDCEAACDESVIRRAPEADRTRYGATLLRVASLSPSPTRRCPGLGVANSKRHLKQRIQMIAAPFSPSPARTFLAASALAVLVGASFTRETIAQIAPPPAASPSPALAPAAASSGVVYDASIDRLDHLFPSGIVATVNDRNITVAEVRAYIAPLIPNLQREARSQEEFNGRLTMLQNSAIKNLVDRAVLIRQFHDRREGEPRQIAAEHIDTFVAREIEERFGGDRTKFLEHLRNRNLTQREYRREVEENIIYQYMRAQERRIAGTTTPTPLKADPSEKPVRLSIIQLGRTANDTDATLDEKARGILARLRSGESFEQLAREFDTSKRRDRGGDWGWVGADDLKPVFRDSVMSLAKGKAAAPILLPEGCFILYVADRR